MGRRRRLLLHGVLRAAADIADGQAVALGLVALGETEIEMAGEGETEHVPAATLAGAGVGVGVHPHTDEDHLIVLITEGVKVLGTKSRTEAARGGSAEQTDEEAEVGVRVAAIVGEGEHRDPLDIGLPVDRGVMRGGKRGEVTTERVAGEGVLDQILHLRNQALGPGQDLGRDHGLNPCHQVNLCPRKFLHLSLPHLQDQWIQWKK